MGLGMIGQKITICAAVGLFMATVAATAAYCDSVTGIASFREDIVLPPEAVFEAVLEDVTLADAPSIEVGKFSVDGRPGPVFEFEIPYDPLAIDPRHSYGVRTTIRIDDRLAFTSDSFYPVLTGEAVDAVDILMIMIDTPEVLPPKREGSGEFMPIDVQAAAKSDQAASGIDMAEPVVGSDADVAVATEKEEEDVVPPLRGMVSYGADGPTFLDCRSGDEVPIIADGDFSALEHAYLAAGREPGLPIMASFEGQLVENEKKNGLMARVDRFLGIWPDETCEPSVSEISLTNTFWKIVQLGDIVLEKLDEQRQPHMILPSEEPRFTATVGCNQMVGSYELSGNRLKFGEAAATMMACQPPLLEWERKLAAVLGETAAWRIDGESLELLNGAGQPVALFEAVFLN